MANEIRIQKVAAEALATPQHPIQVGYVYNEVVGDPAHAVQVAMMYAEVIHDPVVTPMGQPIVLNIT